MNYNILTIPEFDKNTKTLSKKYKNLKKDLYALFAELQLNPKLGSHIIGNCYKIRVANSSIPTVKSGGFRVITYYVDSSDNIYLMSIYSKTDFDSISNEKIIELLNDIK